MFLFLSKKIAIPNGVSLRCLVWNKEEGFIACGGDLVPKAPTNATNLDTDDTRNALLKVIRLDGMSPGAPASTGSLSMNVSLEGHKDPVVCAAWNDLHRKLATSDASGLIVVWVMHNGNWVEEMINNRKQSTVKDVRWSGDGSRVCIAYEDGAVIVGSVDGQRLWGREVGLKLALTEWSPDCTRVLFATPQGQVHAFDGSSGAHLSRVPLLAAQGLGAQFHIVAMDWCPGLRGRPEPSPHCLALALDIGRVQLMRHDADDAPIVFDAAMTIRHCRWSPDGRSLAVGGVLHGGGGSPPSLALALYNYKGVHQQTLRVPGSNLAGIAWDGSGTRLAAAVDAAIFFATVRPHRLWCRIGAGRGTSGGLASINPGSSGSSSSSSSDGETIVYAYSRADRLNEQCVLFWDAKLQEKHVKYVEHLVSIVGGGDHCALMHGVPEDASSFAIVLCNTIGSPLETRMIPMEPLHAAMTATHLVTCSRDVIYLWRYSDSLARDTAADLGTKLRALAVQGGVEGGGASSSDCIWGVDDLPPSDPAGVASFLPPILVTAYPIACVALNATHLVVARTSGIASIYRLLPSGGALLEHEVVLRPNPAMIALNCDSSRLAVVSIHAVLTLAEVQPSQHQPPSQQSQQQQPQSQQQASVDSTDPSQPLPPPPASLQSFERRDVWHVLFSADNPLEFVMCEKNRQWIVHDTTPENEAASSLATPASFSDLQVRCVDLDALFVDPEEPDATKHLQTLETATLRSCRALLNTDQASAACALATERSHLRLWQLIAEHALLSLDLRVADIALVKCGDYHGITLVKHLHALDSDEIRRAEVLLFLKRFDEAQACYCSMDRFDLAIDMRIKLGDWFAVEKLLEQGHGSDAQLSLTRSKLGEYYADRGKWDKARVYFTEARNAEKLAECFAMLENYDALAKMIQTVPENSPLLRELGDKFAAVGMVDEAIGALLRANDTARAIEVCKTLQQWDKALALAQEHSGDQVRALVDKYAHQLLQRGAKFELVELFRKASRHHDAAKMLHELGQEAAETKSNPLRVKQLYLLAALEFDSYQKQELGGGGEDAAATLAAATTLSGVVAAAAAGLNRSAGTRAALMTSSLAGGGGGGGGAGAAARNQTLAGLMTLDQANATDARELVNAWRNVNAYHFWLLAHRQLYAGQVDALRTSLHLRAYEDILGAREVYSLLALAAYHAQYYKFCSKAFIKLETLSSLDPETKERIGSLAVSLFAAHAPQDPSPFRDEELRTANVREDMCVATGRLLRGQPSVRCRACRHQTLKTEAEKRTSCALCHAPMKNAVDVAAAVGGGGMGGGGGMMGAGRKGVGGMQPTLSIARPMPPPR